LSKFVKSDHSHRKKTTAKTESTGKATATSQTTAAAAAIGKTTADGAKTAKICPKDSPTSITS
jgi:hypothetical protein